MWERLVEKLLFPANFLDFNLDLHFTASEKFWDIFYESNVKWQNYVWALPQVLEAKISQIHHSDDSSNLSRNIW